MKAVKLVASIFISFLGAFIGNTATIPNIPTWYAALEKPALNPPNYVFGPVWSVLYTLMGVSLYLVWVANSKLEKRRAYIAFGTQLFLNAWWSLIFFGFHQLEFSVLIIFMMLGAIGWTMFEFRKFSKPAAYLLVPYLLWVSFATYLNIGVMIKN